MLVMMPGVNGRGVSRKIEDEDERRRLKQILDQLDPPEDCGFIIRTESVGKSKVEIERDLKYLARLWEQIKKRRDRQSLARRALHRGRSRHPNGARCLLQRRRPDHYRQRGRGRPRAGRLKLSNPRAKNKVELYEEPIPLFHKWGIEREIEQMYSRHVPLRSGGSLVIDSTEAIVAIDVNSGKNRENSDAEMTAFNTDMEAADEICRQLKLRDLGGVIICDFIDLRYERHRRELEERLYENLKNDRAKTKVLRMSQFGIIEMTRQRMRPSLKRSVYFDCPHCKGAGLVKTPESMSLDVMRRLAIAIYDSRVMRVELAINPDVAYYLQNKKRQALANLEYDTHKQILIKSDAALGLDEMRINLFDIRDGVVIIDELAATQETVPHKTQLNTRPQAIQSRGGRQDGHRDDQRPGQRPQQPQRRNEREVERESFDQEVEELESRTDDFDRDSEEEREVSSAGPAQRRGDPSHHLTTSVAIAICKTTVSMTKKVVSTTRVSMLTANAGPLCNPATTRTATTANDANVVGDDAVAAEIAVSRVQTRMATRQPAPITANVVRSMRTDRLPVVRPTTATNPFAAKIAKRPMPATTATGRTSAIVMIAR